MTKEEALKLAPKSDFAQAAEIRSVNFKPHPFVIGPRHAEHASRHHGGMLGEATCNAIPCAECQKPYHQHAHDVALFIDLLRDVTRDELGGYLNECKQALEGKFKIDGFAFPNMNTGKTPVKNKFRVLEDDDADQVEV